MLTPKRFYIKCIPRPVGCWGESVQLKSMDSVNRNIWRNVKSLSNLILEKKECFFFLRKRMWFY